MALVMGITLPAGIDIVYNKTLRMYDISVFCNVGKNPRFPPRDRKFQLREISYLFSIAYVWAYLSDEVKAQWAAAGEVVFQHGYNLYVQDKSYRLKNGIGGEPSPSVYHQYLVGHLGVGAPATAALFAFYYNHRVNFPATFELCYKSNLSASGANPYARLNFIWTRYYRGANIENTETIEIPLVSGWTKQQKSITSLPGIRGKWRLEIELHDVVGDLWFDNVEVIFSGEIKNLDPFCLEVEKYWKAVIAGAGVSFSSVYPVGGAL